MEREKMRIKTEVKDEPVSEDEDAPLVSFIEKFPPQSCDVLLTKSRILTGFSRYQTPQLGRRRG